jgi:hypothetical protein
MADDMLPISDVVQAVDGLGFERVKVMHGGSFRSAKTLVIIPTRGMIHHRTVTGLQQLMAPMNQARAMFFCVGDEVGQAYNKMIENILADPNLSKWDYVLTIEDDNLVPPDAHIRLLESIEDTGADAVSGIYFTKGDFNAPMAYGNPREYAQTNVLDFRPFPPEEVRMALQNGYTMPVNGIAMGCALWKMDLFRQVPAPWFVTVSDVIDGSPKAYTQDLSFCEKAVKLGKRFAVDFRVRVGHLDINTGSVF